MIWSSSLPSCFHPSRWFIEEDLKHEVSLLYAPSLYGDTLFFRLNCWCGINMKTNFTMKLPDFFEALKDENSKKDLKKMCKKFIRDNKRRCQEMCPAGMSFGMNKKNRYWKSVVKLGRIRVKEPRE